jgi:uncharacterized protein YyaL (SSP411 family)
MAAYALLRLGKLTGRTQYLDAAHQTLQIALGIMERSPTGAGQMLLAVDLAIGPAQELVLVGKADGAVQRALGTRFLPRTVVAWRTGQAEPASPLDPLFAGRTASRSDLTLYVCENFACQAPVIGRDAVLAVIAGL